MGWFKKATNGLASGVSAVGNVVEGTVDAVSDFAEDTVDLIIDTVQDDIIGAGTDWLCKKSRVDSF